MSNNEIMKKAQTIMSECESLIDDLKERVDESGDRRLEVVGRQAAEQIRKAAAEAIGKLYRNQLSERYKSNNEEVSK